MKNIPARSADSLAGIFVAFASLLLFAASVQSHGTEREVRIVGQKLGGYDVTVRTGPTNPRPGWLHIEVQLIAPESLAYIDRATVTATGRFLGGSGLEAGPARSRYRQPWHEMELRLEKTGLWNVHLAIDGPRGQSETDFPVEIGSE